MLTLTVHAQTPASPEQVILLAGTDFSTQRAKVWSNVSKKRLEVHERGDTYADVTESATGIAWFAWERSRYDWSHTGAIRQTVTDLRDEVRAGRQDAHSVDALLTAAGHRVGRRREWPAGLTTREVEVLRLVARGLSNRQIAGRLVISHKTVDNHVEHIYMKIGVSNRARTSLFAIRQGLVAPTEDGYFSPTT